MDSVCLGMQRNSKILIIFFKKRRKNSKSEISKLLIEFADQSFKKPAEIVEVRDLIEVEYFSFW